jgi:H/ACA ribonucleoprotein complex subunit 4
MRLHDKVDIDRLQKVMNTKFVGKITQMPPVKSRVKRQNREREIYSFEILEQGDDEKDILFKVKCEGGTYIRKLIDDLGKEIGVGAHMLELRRISAGIFDENALVNLYDYEKAVDKYKNGNDELLRKIIVPAGDAIRKVYPSMEIKKDNLKQIFTGKPIYKKDLMKDEGWKTESIVSVFCEDEFIGMYKIFRGKEIFARPEFVMQPIR